MKSKIFIFLIFLIIITQISADMELKININHKYNPDDLIKFKINLYNNNTIIHKDINCTIINPSGKIITKAKISSGKEIKYKPPTPPELGDWKIKADYGKLNTSKIFRITQIIRIIKIIPKKNSLKIYYNFDSTDIIGEKATIQIIIKDKNKKEIKKDYDEIPLTKSGVIKRNIQIKLDKKLKGTYTVYMYLLSDKSASAKKSININDNSITGYFILTDSKIKFLGYISIGIIILLIIFIFIKLKNR